jgi:hypothetical protein
MDTPRKVFHRYEVSYSSHCRFRLESCWFHRYEVSYSQKAPEETSGSKTKPIAPLSTGKGDAEPRIYATGGICRAQTPGIQQNEPGTEQRAEAPKQARGQGNKQGEGATLQRRTHRRDLCFANCTTPPCPCIHREQGNNLRRCVLNHELLWTT